MLQSLWGEEFKVDDSAKKAKDILNKINSPNSNYTVEKALKSKNLSIDDKLRIIYDNVKKILGTYKEQTVVLRSALDVSEYLKVAIKNNVISIDTETNNSLDPLTCKLMGVCLYTPGMKNAYIPINHINRLTGERLDNQLTEEEICELLHMVDDVFTIAHNGKFDYQVLKCTIGWNMRIDWDTMIGARLLNENERANLKMQYIDKIDNSIEKYSIEGLFQDIEYAIVDPEIFALYAATDPFMTYKLYEYQLKIFKEKENKKLFNLFKEVEMPIVKISGDMELRGICIDSDYSKRLSVKYNNLLNNVTKKIEAELKNYEQLISQWRMTKEANIHKTSKAGKVQKSKSEQLNDPIDLSSPTQLSILLYDILKIPTIDTKNPRGTGAEILEQINLPLCKLLIEQKTLSKLLTSFIDVLPNQLNKQDNRLHSHFNQLGTKTGRFSSTEPNLQQIPSKNKEIRMMFCADVKEHIVEEDENNCFKVSKGDEVEVDYDVWVSVDKLKVGDIINFSDGTHSFISMIDIIDKYYYIYY